ncbi:PilZ domain-containing protein [Noviherbaspirillum sp. UKPF54]|uniref:PilZ domain-containing protein n=1 Tax=Noviherbaspirillum sp. UKPF54 TaxID=2601898 RepID=UPI0011B13A95|nr:PilZ domain-containing protein [Noviherbaspirillum sp. UKPF54]QDZ29628.1 PilZ domain-containing protein [Noviherbaspirillum sp. UKPF54]
MPAAVLPARASQQRQTVDGEKIVAEQLKLDDLQSYGELFAPGGPPPLPRGEQRQSDRKRVEVAGVLTIDGVPVEVSTVDISSGGMCVRSVRQLAVGKECQLGFALAATGGARDLAARVQVIYCFYTVEQDFKVGLEFLHIDADAARDISRFVGA